MFGKTREINEMDTIEPVGEVGEFFGDEAAVQEAAHVGELRTRVESVESQINSQFTSLAAYAQIAQEQIELARSEAKATCERSEHRLTSLIERERNDRIASITGEAPAGSVPDVTARLDALEHSVAQIRHGLDECLERQKALADAITVMFERTASPASPATCSPSTDSPSTVSSVSDDADTPAAAAAKPNRQDDAPFDHAPSVAAPMVSACEPIAGPIADLSLTA